MNKRKLLISGCLILIAILSVIFIPKSFNVSIEYIDKPQTTVNEITKEDYLLSVENMNYFDDLEDKDYQFKRIEKCAKVLTDGGELSVPITITVDVCYYIENNKVNIQNVLPIQTKALTPNEIVCDISGSKYTVWLDDAQYRIVQINSFTISSPVALKEGNDILSTYKLNSRYYGYTDAVTLTIYIDEDDLL